MSKNDLEKIAGRKSWKLQNDTVQAYVTKTGGHLAPVTFDRKHRKIQPYAIAPWCKEKQKHQPKILQVLRGDFFCLPFGGNDSPYRGDKFPVHGETANRKWKFIEQIKDDDQRILHLRMKTKIRTGMVDKYIRLVRGQNAVYSRHVISEMRGKMPLGHHATLQFPDDQGSGLVSVSPFVLGRVYTQPTEDPAQGGYSILQPGATFDKLGSVPMITGDTADLSRYPARRGYEDIVIMVTDPSLDFGWTAVSFPDQGYVWFALKDPEILASTLLWMSNGGRHYPPWNGRHMNVMGLEEITGCFHEGIKSSVGKNQLQAQGVKTTVSLTTRKPTTVNYIQACVPTSGTFGRVQDIKAGAGNAKVMLTDENGNTIDVPIDLSFLTETGCPI